MVDIRRFSGVFKQWLVGRVGGRSPVNQRQPGWCMKNAPNN